MTEHYSDHDPERGCGLLALVAGGLTAILWIVAVLMGFGLPLLLFSMGVTIAAYVWLKWPDR